MVTLEIQSIALKNNENRSTRETFEW